MNELDVQTLVTAAARLCAAAEKHAEHMEVQSNIMNAMVGLQEETNHLLRMLIGVLQDR